MADHKNAAVFPVRGVAPPEGVPCEAYQCAHVSVVALKFSKLGSIKEEGIVGQRIGPGQLTIMYKVSTH